MGFIYLFFSQLVKATGNEMLTESFTNRGRLNQIDKTVLKANYTQFIYFLIIGIGVWRWCNLMTIRLTSNSTGEKLFYQ